MQTKHFIYNSHGDSNAVIKEAAALLGSGELVAMPTETVYGLAANALDEQAVAKIFEAKGRPNDNPLIVHVASIAQMQQFTTHYPPYVDRLVDAFSPGPITYVLNSNRRIASNATGGLHTIGIRIPNHQAALELIQESDLPLAAPSANVSGRPSPTTAQHVADDLAGKIAAILDGGAADVGVESTVVDCTGEQPIILRPGHITKEAIKQIVGCVGVSEGNGQTNMPKSPGVKYKHYVPEVPLILVESESRAETLMRREKQSGKRIGILGPHSARLFDMADSHYFLGNQPEEIAANLYEQLRAIKQGEVDLVVASGMTEESVGSAVWDRLERAAIEII